MRKLLNLFVCMIVLVGCAKQIQLQKHTFTIELGKDVYANPALYVKEGINYDTNKMSVQAISNGIRKKDNRFITGGEDYLVVGEYDFKLMNGNDEYPFKIKIKDTKPPTINHVPSEISVAKETIIDWSDYVDASDLSGVSFSVNTNFSTAESGQVDIILKIADRFGNAVEYPVRVIIQ